MAVAHSKAGLRQSVLLGRDRGRQVAAGGTMVSRVNEERERAWG
jgi:hypothetical protein